MILEPNPLFFHHTVDAARKAAVQVFARAFVLDSLKCSSVYSPGFSSFWAVSSVGRAHPLQGWGHWFKPSTAHHRLAD